MNSSAGRFKIGRAKARTLNDSRKKGNFKGKCFKCNQFGHMKRDCTIANNSNGDDAVFAAGDECKAGWLIDSGATLHMTPHRHDLFDYEGVTSGGEVTIADGKKLQLAGSGTVWLTNVDGRRIKMINVLHIPGLDRRLLSVGKLAVRGMSVEFQRLSCTIWSKEVANATGKTNGKAYVLYCQQEEAQSVQYSGADSKWELWHARMRHPSEDSLYKTRHARNGMPVVKQGIKTLCGGCLKGKQTVTVFPSHSLSRTSCVLELVHMDVMGPMRTISKGGARYILTLVDDYSRYAVAFMLKNKSQVPDKIKFFKNLYENQ